MKCPLLIDTQVRFCEVAPFRKMIPRRPRPEDHEKCSSPDYVRCPSYKGRFGVRSEAGTCPFLREALVQYCAGAPVVRFIPYSDALLSPCQSEGHHRCDLYTSRAEPGHDHAGSPEERSAAGPCAGGEACRSSTVKGLRTSRRPVLPPGQINGECCTCGSDRREWIDRSAGSPPPP